MRHAAILVVVLILLAVPASAQIRGGTTTNGQYAIRGRLAFSTPKAPEDRIEIALERNMQRVAATFADSLGNFEFHNLGVADYQIVIRLAGYEDVNQMVSIFPSQMNTTVTIQMNSLYSVVRKRNPAYEGDDPDVVDAKLISKSYPKKALQEYQKGLDESRKGVTEKAIAHFEEAVKVAPDFFDAWNNLGISYVKKERFQDGESAYKRAHELNPKSHQPLLNLAIAYIALSDKHRADGREVYGKYLDDAMDNLDAAIKLRPQSAMSHYYLGTANYKSGFYPEAEESLKAALDLNPEFESTRIMLVNVYVREHRLKDAMAQIDAFIKEHPKSQERPELENLRQKIAKGIETP
jgi:tetratricopeptide (TPR) repeat protein